jgi:hypothetical protein
MQLCNNNRYAHACSSGQQRPGNAFRWTLAITALFAPDLCFFEHVPNAGKCSAAATGGTVGHPFKDTAGPSFHGISASMATTMIVLGPLFIGSPP